MNAVPRRASVDDAAEVARVLSESRAANVGAIPASVHADAEVQGWVREQLVVQCEVWVVDDPTLCAVLALSDGWIEQLYVAPGHTDQGLGSQLVELAKQRRPAGLQLWTFETNEAAQRFYVRHGFGVVERTDGSANEEHAPDVRFAWSPPHPQVDLGEDEVQIR